MVVFSMDPPVLRNPPVNLDDTMIGSIVAAIAFAQTTAATGADATMASRGLIRRCGIQKARH
jgi:hypothetical protein